jgi:hypothetical protein
MVEGYQTYYFEGTLWWQAIGPIILWVLDLEGYQTYYFVVFYGGRLSDLLCCGILWWKAIGPIILWVLFRGRLSV